MYKPIFRGWWFSLSGANGAVDVLDLLSAHHREPPPHVSPLVGLEAEIRVVSDTQIGDIGT